MTLLAPRSSRRAAPAPGASRTESLTWRLVLDEPRPGAANMALDHALARCLGADEAVLRLYGWSSPTVSFGRNEPAARLGAGPGGVGALDYVRRPTGGRAVLHDDEVTYAVVAPLDALGGPRRAYVRVHEALAEALRSLGAAVEVAGDGGEALGPDAGPCFQAPAAGELVAGGRKVVGSAQARLEGALLQHGSILLGGDQGPLAGADEAAPVTLSELLGPIGRDEVARAVAAAVRAAFGGAWERAAYRTDELAEAERLETEKYTRDTWTWRRRAEGA